MGNVSTFEPSEETMGTAARVSSDGESRLKVWQSAALPGIVYSRGKHVTHTYPKHWHDEIHFCAYDAGSGFLAYDGNSRLVGEGDLVVMPPGVVHENWVSAAGGISFFGAYMDMALLRRGLGQICEGEPRLPEFRHLSIKDVPVQRRFRALCAEASDDNQLKQDAMLLEFLSSLASQCAVRATPAARAGDEPVAVRRAREYIDEHFHRTISLAELGHLTGLSAFHLHRVFSRQTGMPPHAYQTQLRINRAKQLLRQLRSLSEVALMTGFADQSHFTRHFRRLVGITPGRFAA